mmetsp:Transcript_5095/g.12244  ORF Transcript_5095/g.12244 Transcript_5095/m.12244 type:complete len:294 (-) Transcript_5095:107-988(-)
MLLAEDLAHDVRALLGVGEVDEEGAGHPPEDRFVNRPRPVRRAHHDYLGGLVCADSVPKRHEFALHVVAGLEFAVLTLTEEGVDLVDEDDARLHLPRQREHRLDELLRLAEPLVLQRRQRDVEKHRLGLLGDSLSKHGLPRPRRPVEQHTLRRAQQRPAREELGARERQHHDVPQTLLLLQQPSDVLEGHVDRSWINRFLGDHVFVLVRLHVRPPEASHEGLARLLALLLRLAVGVHLFHDPHREQHGNPQRAKQHAQLHQDLSNLRSPELPHSQLLHALLAVRCERPREPPP